MRILFVVPYAPNLVRVRPFNLIRRLFARGHQVTVATIVTDDREREDVHELSRSCSRVRAVTLPRWRSLANCARALATSAPLQSRYSWSPELAAHLARLGDEADVVHIEHLRGAEYGLDPRAGLTAMPTVWDSVDCISDLFEQAVMHRQDRIGRWINRIELSRTKLYEGRAVSAFHRTLVTSEQDKASLKRLAARPGAFERPLETGLPGTASTDDPISVLPNGVDLDYFRPSSAAREPDTIVFSGKLSYHANETAVRYLLTAVMPHVWAAVANVKLWLVGQDPSRELRRLAAARPGQVVITGTVPDIRPYLRGASVAVAPLVYGVGCQNKVLEAMACATPVVATPRAVHALSARADCEALVADHPMGLAEAMLALLQDRKRQREIGDAGRAYVEAHHRWDRIAARLERIYEEVVAPRDGRRLERAAG